MRFIVPDQQPWSAAGYIVNARRSRLTDQMLEDMLIAKYSKDFMHK